MKLCVLQKENVTSHIPAEYVERCPDVALRKLVAVKPFEIVLHPAIASPLVVA